MLIPSRAFDMQRRTATNITMMIFKFEYRQSKTTIDTAINMLKKNSTLIHFNDIIYYYLVIKIIKKYFFRFKFTILQM